MELSILIPHFKNGKATAYAISKLLQYKGEHSIRIIVSDNNMGDGSIAYLEPFIDDILVLNYPDDVIQSHGIAFDWLISQGVVTTPYFMTIESDSFPTNDTWLDYYESLTKEGVDLAASFLRLSGGLYGHPCGALYKKTFWEKAKRYCDKIQYSCFPNMSVKEGFDSHLLVHDSILDQFLEEPQDYIELARGYWGLSKEKMLERRNYYKPTLGPFHSGISSIDESIHTYGQRNVITCQHYAVLDNKRKLINLIGREPGQWISEFAYAVDAKVHQIPTEVKWLPNRENQQQEYTINEAGFKHIWAGSSFLDMENTDMHDVYEFKKNQIEELYNSLPDHQKIKL